MKDLKNRFAPTTWLGVLPSAAPRRAHFVPRGKAFASGVTPRYEIITAESTALPPADLSGGVDGRVAKRRRGEPESLAAVAVAQRSRRGIPRRARRSSPTPERVGGGGGSGVSQPPRPYRENVVGFILNRRNDVLIMKRTKARWHWQLPQGGVEPSETKRQAVLREMREETGLKGLRIIGVVENFHAYDWPKTQVYLADEFRGQRQTLFFLRYTAKGLGVSLDPKEATGWRWVPIKDLLQWLAPVRHAMAKKALYYYQQLYKPSLRGMPSNKTSLAPHALRKIS